MKLRRMIPGSGPLLVLQLHARRRTLPLASPLVTGKNTWREREIVLIRAEIERDGARHFGWGETAPLAVWSTETLDQAADALAAIELPLSIGDGESLESACPAAAGMPSVRAGLELALLDALARALERPLAALLTAPESTFIGTRNLRVPVQFTLGARGLDETREALRRARDQGYRAVKLKVGACSLDQDLERVATVAGAFPEFELRLDANGAWPVDTALDALRRMPAALIEQPVAPGDLDALLDQCSPRPGRPAIAADESCASLAQASALIEPGRIDALVIKPCTLGGLLPTLKIIESARAAGITVILSNLMESAVGRRGVAHLAAAMPELPGPHGLATGAWFAGDLDSDRVEHGELLLGNDHGLGFDPDAGGFQ